MRLQRIYSSKLYLTNPRREQINAAINKVENVELVQQLAEYLDDDSKAQLDEIIDEKIQEKEAEKAAEAQKDAPAESEGPVSQERNVFSPSYSGGHSSMPPSGGDFGGSDEPSIFDEGEDAPEEAPQDAPEPSDDPVQESTAVYGEIKADTQLDIPVIDLASECNTIKGTLNSREDTAGVLRLAIDDDELWIYYKDEVNIGDIMVNVIEALNGTAYTYLAFSRLARSNNAIVFDITLNMQEPVKSIQEASEEA